MRVSLITKLVRMVNHLDGALPIKLYDTLIL